MARRFGIPVTSVHALGSEFNQTFEVRAKTGDRFVAKVFGRDDIDTVRWQHRLMDRIAEVGDVVVPHVLRDSEGRDICAADGRSRHLRIYLGGRRGHRQPAPAFRGPARGLGAHRGPRGPAL